MDFWPENHQPWMKQRRDPRWIPSPQFLCQLIYDFFMLKRCKITAGNHGSVPVVLSTCISAENRPCDEIKSDAEENPCVTHISIPSNPFVRSDECVIDKRAEYFGKKALSTKTTSHSKSWTHSCNGNVLASGSVVERETKLSVLQSDKCADVSVGPCPCFVSETDPYSLRNFRPPSAETYLVEAAASEDVRRLHQDYGVVSKHNVSLRDEVDRLEASLSAMEELGLGSSNSPFKEIRVVLYGDLGSAIADELPKDSLSEGLYAVNMKLLNRLESEKKKVEGRNGEIVAMSAHLQTLVSMVDSFQIRLEEHLTQDRAFVPSKRTSSQSNREAGTESGFGDAGTSDVLSLADDNVALDDVLQSTSHSANIHSSFSSTYHPDQSVESKLALELRNILDDLHKVVGDISNRETKWSDEQKSMVLFSGDLCSRLSAVLKSVAGLKHLYEVQRVHCESAFSGLREDVASSLEELHLVSRSLLCQNETADSGSSAVRDVERERIRTWQQQNFFGERLAWERSDHTAEDRLQSASHRVENTAEITLLREKLGDYGVLEERYQSAVKRMQNSNQEKLLLESTVEKLKDELELAQYEKESLLKKNERTLMSLNSVLTEKGAVESALSTVTADLENASSVRWALESSNVLLRDTITGLQAQKDVLSAANLRYSEEKVTMECALSRQDEDVAALKKNVDALRTENENLLTERHRTAGQGLQLQTVSEERDAVAREKDELRERLERLQVGYDELLPLKVDLETALQEISALHQTIDGKEFWCKRMEICLADEQATIKILRDQLAERDASLRSHEDQITELTRSINALQGVMEELNITKIELEAEVSKREVDGAELRAENASLLADLSSRSEEVQQLENNVRERSDRIHNLSSELESMENVLDELSQANKAVQLLKSDIEEALQLSSRTLEHKNDELDQLDQELREKISWIHENQREIDTLRSEVVDLKDENSRLREDIRARFGELEDIAGRFNMVQEELSQLKPRLETENANLALMISELDEKNAGLCQEIDKLNRELEVNCGKLSETAAQVSQAQEGLSQALQVGESNRDRCRDLEERNREISELNARIAREKSDLEEYLIIYNQIVGTFCDLTSKHQKQLARDILVFSPDLMADHHHTVPIFTPDGVIYVEEEDEPQEEGNGQAHGASPVDGNDSGVAEYLTNGQAEEHHLPTRTDSFASAVGNVRDLLDKLEHGRSSAPPVLHAHTDALTRSIRLTTEAAFRDLEYNKSATVALRRTVQDLGKNVQNQNVQRERLSEQRDGLKDQVEDFMVEVRNLKKTLQSLEAEKSSSQNEVETKENDVSELSNLLKNAENEIDGLRRSYATASSTIRELNNTHSSLLQQRENEIETLKNDLQALQSSSEAAVKQNERNEERLQSLLTKLNETDTIISELSANLREAESKGEQSDHLTAKAEALDGLEKALDARIIQIQEREDTVRRLEQQVASFVTDQLTLTNKEVTVNQRAKALEAKESDLCMRETDLAQKFTVVRNAEENIKKRETSVICQAAQREKLSLDRVASQHQEEKHELSNRLRSSEGQVGDLRKSFKDMEDQLNRFREESESARDDNRKLRETLDSTIRNSVPKADYEAQMKQLNCTLAERSQQISAMCNEQERLKTLLQDSERQLKTMKRTSDTLEQRLHSKVQGEGNLEERFNAINLLYADSLAKYRELSEAYDELEIQIVRNKDEFRDAKRELDKLVYTVRRHLDGSGASLPSRSVKDNQENEGGYCPSVTKNMDRSRQSRQIDSFSMQNNPSTSGNQTFSPAPERRSASRSSRKNTDNADYNVFREKVLTRLYEDSSRQSIALEEALLHTKQRSPVCASPNGDYSGSDTENRRGADPVRRQANKGADESEGPRLRFAR